MTRTPDHGDKPPFELPSGGDRDPVMAPSRFPFSPVIFAISAPDTICSFTTKTHRKCLKAIANNGKIVAILNAKLGENKIIVLNPKPAMGATTIDWQCWSNYPRNLLGGGELEICESREIF